MEIDDADIDDALRAAVALHQSGRLAEAERAYAAILAQHPDHPDALHLTGVACAQTGRAGAAVRFMAQAVALNPGSAAYRGNLHKALARAADAEQADAFAAAADALTDGGRPAEAAALYRTALALRPDALAGWFDLGIALRDAGRGEAALPAFRRAGVLAPGLARPDLEIGQIRHALHDAAGAARAFRRALAREPLNADAWFGLANAVKATGAFAPAVDLYRTALALAPARREAWYNMAVTLADQDRNVAAIHAYRRALAAAPDDAHTHCNLAHQLLLTGRFAEGWREFEWRFQANVAFPGRGRPRWRGEPPEGRTILLYGEQGHGDTLQFVRYAPLVAARGARVVVECPPALVRLLATVPGVADVHPLGATPAFDLICPMMSLPLVFGTEVDTVPAAIPYMADRFPGDERFDRFFTGDGVRRVGLVWAGEPRPEDRRWSFADRRRSLPLQAFAPLLDVPGVRLYSLQMGAAAEQAREAPFDACMVDPMGEVADFADTAGIVRRLDLVISVDTAVAHLAGAVGRPVWLLSRFDGCWRWLAGREDSPWYPGLRVFRQPRLDDWRPVLDRLAGELRAWAGGDPLTP
ncbi:tetratricopeptide repeat protein [Azospirillum sp.]|uniref:tetratricopeptide repeat protein n=1 Tax=Azospirillum sp. TaxID=34012 RepID=UPI002D3FF2E4|nr:tetratricopeptide repeat protein [Azospirillum sp.]HYD66256.1 tetratricopeptide repeat protein [Azospirillum sp.]